MMDWQDVRIQLIDTPPITADFLESYVSSIVRSADACLLLLDLGDDDGPFALETVLTRLAETKTELVGVRPAVSEDPTIHHAKTLLVANKIDVPGASDRLEIAREMFGQRFSIETISAEHGTGLEELRTALFRFLNVIRVYTKQPGKPPDLESPFTCPVGSTLVEMAGLVHRDFVEGLKSCVHLGNRCFRRPNGQARSYPPRQRHRGTAPLGPPGSLQRKRRGLLAETGDVPQHVANRNDARGQAILDHRHMPIASDVHLVQGEGQCVVR